MFQGWNTVLSCDMNSLYSSLPSVSRAKVLSLEPFDEYEEWQEKCTHYHIQCALQGTCQSIREHLIPLVAQPTMDIPPLLRPTTPLCCTDDIALLHRSYNYDDNLALLVITTFQIWTLFCLY